jgi:hypothetical protein
MNARAEELQDTESAAPDHTVGIEISNGSFCALPCHQQDNPEIHSVSFAVGNRVSIIYPISV